MWNTVTNSDEDHQGMGSVVFNQAIYSIAQDLGGACMMLIH